MKLFVWIHEGYGRAIFAYADSVDEARKQVQLNADRNQFDDHKALTESEPIVIEQPAAVVIWADVMDVNK